MKRFALFLFVIIMFACQCVYGGIKPKSYGGNTVQARIFVLSVGIDNSPGLTNLQYCESDARRFAALYSDTSKIFSINFKKHIGDSSVDMHGTFKVVYNKVMAGKDANLASINEQINYIINEASADDIFIFYFAGYGNLYTDNLSAKKDFALMLSDSVGGQNLNSAAVLNQKCITSGRFKSWLSRIRCDKQVIVTDASYGQDFFNLFASQIIEKDALIGEMQDKDRIFIYAKPDLAIEGKWCGGGFLTHLIVSMPDTASMLQLYDNNRFRKVHHFLNSYDYRSFQKHAGPLVLDYDYLTIAYERDIRSLLKLLQPECDGGSRGITINDKKPEPTPVATIVKNYALIIGTDLYDDPSWRKLNNPIFDATTVADELKTNYGFQTELIKNPTKKEFYQALFHYSREIQYDSMSQLYIFIAGHGGYDEFVNGYIACKDSKNGADDQFRESYIMHSQLSDMINKIPCKHIFVMMDVCFGGTFDQNSTSYAGNRSEDQLYKNVNNNEFINRKMKNASRLYITSGGKEYVPDGRPGQHSPFASKFIEALRNYGGEDKILTFYEIKTFVEKCKPEPKAGDFGYNEPGSDFLFISK